MEAVSDEVFEKIFEAVDDLLHRGDCLNRGMCDEVSKFSKDGGETLCMRRFAASTSAAWARSCWRANQIGLGQEKGFCPATRLEGHRSLALAGLDDCCPYESTIEKICIYFYAMWHSSLGSH